MLPDTALLRELEATHPEYDRLLPIWQCIDDVASGSPAFLQYPQKYLPRRPGEDDELYNNRLRKASYTPVVMPAIRRLVSKLTSAPIAISGIDKTQYPWQQLLTSMDGNGADEAQWLSDCFKQLLLYGQVAVAVDRPAVPVRSRLEAEQVAPYCVMFPVETVRNWGDGWVLTRTVETRQLPLQEAVTVVVWTVWTDRETAVYEAPVKLDAFGRITKLQMETDWAVPRRATVVPKLRSVSVRRRQLVLHKLPEGMQLGFDLYPKQIQHFVIESSWTDAGSVAGSVQRVFTPAAPTPVADPRAVYETPSYSEAEFGNSHVLVGAGFRFEESTGSAIAALTSQLETIERQIRTIASLEAGSVSKGTLEQSGRSKELDQVALQESMRSYGSRVCQMLEDVLQVAASLSGQPETIRVTGLSEYTTGNLESMLDGCDQVLKIAPWLPDTALAFWFTKLALLMVGSPSPEQQESIRVEMDTKEYSLLRSPQDNSVTDTTETTE